MSQQEIAIILKQLENLREDTIRMHQETCNSMERGFTQHAKLFSDWGAIVLEEKKKTTDILLWKEGHTHETMAVTKMLESVAKTQQKITSDIAKVQKYQDNQKTIIAFVATLVSVVWVVVTFVLDKILK